MNALVALQLANKFPHKHESIPIETLIAIVAVLLIEYMLLWLINDDMQKSIEKS